MENSKRKQRTPEEIIAETEARLERLRVRQAKAEAQSNPAVASLMDAKADLMKEVREAKKLLGDGPQSANARIAKHEAWIEKINDSVIASAISRNEMCRVRKKIFIARTRNNVIGSRRAARSFKAAVWSMKGTSLA